MAVVSARPTVRTEPNGLADLRSSCSDVPSYDAPVVHRGSSSWRRASPRRSE